MNDQIKRYLDHLPGDFEPIVKQANKYYSADNKAGVRKDGAIQIFNRTWVAPENYGLLLFPPADNNLLDKFEKRNNLKTPKSYHDILGIMNGCFVYGFNLFGLPESLYSTGRLNRDFLCQFDLGSANKFWKFEYKINADLFHIGSRKYSPDENIGYFIDDQDKIISLLKTGKQIKSWPNFQDFLSDEISIAEDMMLDEIPKE
ncbi:MAG TPA: SMI1/KNR4 family protein [Chryseolinea sp.]